MEQTMIRQCVYCGKFLGVKEPLHDNSITHGACQECFEKAKAEILKGVATENPWLAQLL